MQDFDWLDLAALCVFLAGWFGYYFITDHTKLAPRTLNRRMEEYRLMWMARMLTRDGRIVDTQIMASLQNGAAFFASTSFLAIGGTFAAFSATDAALEVFASLPYAPVMTRTMFDAKLLGLAAIFVYGFFKFAWSYRLFNYSAIILGGAPLSHEAASEEARLYAGRAARMNITAGRNFNRGLRAFFFALAYLGWFGGPWILMATTTGVLIVLLRRQFSSPPLEAVNWNG